MGAAALASPELAGVHFTGSTGVFQAIWRTIGNDIDRYRNYPRIVGETGGKDFILAHPSADPAPSRPRSSADRSSTRARSARPRRRVYIPSNLWDEVRDALQREVGRSPWATSATSRTSWAP